MTACVNASLRRGGRGPFPFLTGRGPLGIAMLFRVLFILFLVFCYSGWVGVPSDLGHQGHRRVRAACQY